MTLRAGVAEGTITPPLGIRLSGYGARHEPANAVHDDLRVQALVLEHGLTRVALVTCDLVGLPVPLAHAWRAAIAAQAGMPPEHVLLSSSHTHAGPATGLFEGAPTAREAAYLEHLRQCLIGTAETAAAALRPARLRLTAGRLRLQRNRRNRLPGQHGPLDDALGVLCVDRADDGAGEAPLAVVVHYACHPVALRHTNLGWSADYVGWLRETVRQETGATCLFVQGAAGDLTPDAEHETLVVQGSGHDPGADKGFPGPVTGQIALAQRLGRRVGREAARLTAQARGALAGVTLGGVTRAFPAAFAPETDPADAAGWAAGQPAPLEVHSLRLGPLAIVGLPVEPLNALGLQVRALAHPAHPAQGPAEVWCAGYAGGCYGYLAPREEYPRGGYEVGSAHRYYGRPGPFTPDTAERVLAEAREGVAALWRPE